MTATEITNPETEARLTRAFKALGPKHIRGFVNTLDDELKPLMERIITERSGIGWRADPLSMAEHYKAMRRMSHTELLSRKFVDAVRGRSTRQIWNLPARYGKSMIGSQWGATWAFDDDPSIKLALASYGKSLASENATIVRDNITAYGDDLRVKLSKSRRRNDRFTTTAGGGLIAAGVGSSLTGFGANGIIVDDPFKDSAEAHSEARRDKVWDWYRAVIRTRLEDRIELPGFIIVVMTRWHEDDLTGKLLQAAEDEDGAEWELIRLPAIAEAPNPDAVQSWMRAPDLLGRKVGEPLAPMLFTKAAVLERARDLGSYITAGMEQQRPSPEEGTDIMRSWWKYGDPPTKFDKACTSWDMKLKDKESGDFVVGQAWGRTASHYWCVDQLRGQWNMPTTKAAIALLAIRNPQIGTHLIENTGNGPEVIDELRRGDREYVLSDDIAGKLGMTDYEKRLVQNVLRHGMAGLIPINPKGDKRARMRAQTPKIESGNVHLKLHANFVQGFVEEMAAFPNGAHDDQVDSCSQALKRLSGNMPRPPKKQNRAVGKPKPAASAVRGPLARARTGSVAIARPRTRAP